MITKEEVKHIAGLARLGLSGKEVEKFQDELSSILSYFEKLQKLDVSGAAATSHPSAVKNVMRRDEAKGNPAKAGQGKKILGDFLKVKSILK